MTDEQKRKSWFQRNWGWFVPVVVFGGITVLFAFTALIASLVFGFIRNSDVFQQAVQIAVDNPDVRAVIGEPVKTGFFVNGNLNIRNDAGDADLHAPLKGPDGEGSLAIVATRRGGVWTFTTLEFSSEDGRRIDLTASLPARSHQE